MYEWWNLFFTDMHVFALSLVFGAVVFAILCTPLLILMTVKDNNG